MSIQSRNAFELPPSRTNFGSITYGAWTRHQSRDFGVAMVLPSTEKLLLTPDNTKIFDELVNHHGPILHALIPEIMNKQALTRAEGVVEGRFSGFHLCISKSNEIRIPFFRCTLEHKGLIHTFIFDMEEPLVVELLEQAAVEGSIVAVISAERQSDIVRIPVPVDTCDYINSVIAGETRYLRPFSRTASYIVEITAMVQPPVPETGIVHSVATQHTLKDAIMAIDDIPETLHIAQFPQQDSTEMVA